MIEENKESYDMEAPKAIATRLRQKGNMIVSPIDLSLENSEKVSAEDLQWLNFYEPPLRLTLSNKGDNVMVRGHWQNHHMRPTLVGGPLDGHYVFSQAHFHWDCPGQEHAKHTINGKSNILEMHALFYKSTYQCQAEAQEKEDGIVIVIYFYKIDQRSSFKWLTDQLGDVVTPEAVTSLPPAPLCALMRPFTRDYLAYWGALACTCHHVLWLVSRTPLRVTYAELQKFGKVQNSLHEKKNRESMQNVKTVGNIFQINSSNELELLFPDATDPPCQISALPNQITIAVDYLKMGTPNNTAINVSGSEVIQESSSLSAPENSSSKEDLVPSDSNYENKTQLGKMCVHHPCRICKKLANAKGTIQSNTKASKKKSVVVAKKNTLECEKNGSAGKIKIKIKKERKRKSDERLKKESEEARRQLEKEKEEIKLIKKALDDELKRLAESRRSQETQTDDIVNEEESSPTRARPPIHKSLLTSKPRTVLVSGENLRENIETKRKSTPTEHSDQTEASSDKKDEDPKTKSKLPVRKFTPWRPQEGLKSSLTPYFSNARGKSPSEKRPESPLLKERPSGSGQTPKSSKQVIGNRAKVSQHQDLGGKGDVK